MEDKDPVNLLAYFTGKSETFCAFMFTGHYNMPSNDFLVLFRHYCSTGENLLDNYSMIRHSFMDSDNLHMLIMTKDEYDKVVYTINHDIIKCLVPEEDLIECLHISSIKYGNLTRLDEKERRRIRANLYIADRKVRKTVFDLHGDRCLICNSQEKICLDHVIPVHIGGEDSIDNLQPLCVACNSKKGTKIADYRIKK